MSANVATLHPVHPANLNDEIAALALQLEEIQCFTDGLKGKNRENEVSDVEMALAVYQLDMQQYTQFLNDMRYANSIAEAVDSDAPAIAEIVRSEAQAERDRQLAFRMSGQDAPEDAPPPYSEATVSDGFSKVRREAGQMTTLSSYSEYQMSALKEPFPLQMSDSEDDAAGPSMTYRERQERALAKMPLNKTACIACSDLFPSAKIVSLSCDHEYCNGCLKTLFMKSTKDESLFPPRCCRQEIDISIAAPILNEEELAGYQNAQVEFTTNDRTYCSNNQCGKFVPPDSVIQNDEANCRSCGTVTCVHCKAPWHEGDCPEDTALQATLVLAREQRWQRCHACRGMVELTHGCYHMTCKCGAQFCYLCGVPWKNCNCERWEERDLIQRAEQVVDREAPHPLPRQVRAARVVQMRQELLEQHECDHPGKFERIFRRGRFECEICGDQHRKYILRCRRCHMEVCEDCRRNRIR